jgi:hypothetical protein
MSPSGRIALTASSPPRNVAEISDIWVRTMPGATTYASTPSLACTRATVWVTALIAALVAA